MYGDDNTFGYGGGGFDVSGFGNGETPQADKKPGFKRTDHLVPVTVRQVIESPDSGLKIGQSDVEAHMLKLVGIIKKIDRSSVKITYTLEDYTGSLEGQHWLNNDEDNFSIPVVENTYSVMIGSLRNISAQNNTKFIMVYNIYPVSDLNEITQHTLEIIHIHYKSEDLSQQVPINAPRTGVKQELTSTYGGIDSSNGGSNYAVGFSLNPQQQRVLKAVQQAGQSETGASVTAIMNALTVKMPLKEVEKVLEFLSNEGHIYSTSDDNHYKAIDAA